MIQPKDFLFYLTNAAGDSYYLDSSGAVALDASNLHEIQTPDGWMDMLLNWERGFTYYGIMRTYTVPLKFVGDAATILKDVYYNQGVQGELKLKIYKFNRDENIWDHELFYEGEIDLSQFEDNQPDYVTCKVMEGGFIADLFAKENIDYEIDLDTHPDKVMVKMDGIELEGSFNYNLDLINNPNWNPFTSSDRYYPQITFYGNEGINNLLVGNYQLEDFIGVTSVDNYLLYNGNVTQQVTIKGTFSVSAALFGSLLSPAQSTNVKLILIQVDEAGTDTVLATLHTHLITKTAINPTVDNYNIVLNNTVTLNPKCKYQLAFISDVVQFGSSTTLALSSLSTFDFSIKCLYRKEFTYVPALRPKDLAQSLLNKISQSYPVVIDSNNLDNINNTKVITCGDALRGLSGAKIKIKFADLHKAFNSVFDLGIHFKASTNTVYYDDLNGVIFESREIADIGEVKELKVLPANELLFSKLRIGYNSQTYDDVNGRDEFNQSVQFETPINRVTSEMDFTSPIRSDCYGAEFARINLSGKNTSDASSDNDNWFLDIEEDSNLDGSIVYYNLFRYSFGPATATGLITPSTVFNMRLSPKHNLFTKGDFIASCMQPMNAKDLVFTSGNKNTNFILNDGVKTYTENADENIATLGNPFFVPLYFIVKTRNLANIYTIIQNPLGFIKFQYKGNNYYGWAMKVSDNPTMPREQEFKLIAKIGTDLTKLINRG